MIEIPIVICFGIKLFSVNTGVLEIQAYLLVADILIKFKTAYYELGIMVKNSKKIIINYFKQEFFLNLIAVGSLIYYLNVQVFDTSKN